MKPKKRHLFFALAAATALTLAGCAGTLAARLPAKWTVRPGEALRFAGLPLAAVGGDVRAGGAAGGSYTTDLRLFGLIEVRRVRVQVEAVKYVVPDGGVFGIKLYTSGVMVNGVAGVDTTSGLQNPAAAAGVRKGDVLVAVNGQPVNTNAEVGALIAASGGAPCKLNLRRGGVDFETTLRPARSAADGSYKAGLWVRDSTAGIGTITYFDPDTGIYGGLGHPVSDVDTGETLPLLEGEAVRSDINGVQKGAQGRAGELLGTLSSQRMGSLLVNGGAGVFGLLESPRSGKAWPTALPQQVRTGSASILATVDESGPQLFSVFIEQVRYNGAGGHDMVVRVTDARLIRKTGGIVQGMSGSPLLQNGRLVGAVTHVFVGNPQKGYAIFIENMLHAAKAIETTAQKGVS